MPYRRADNGHMSTSLRSIPCHTDAELQQLIAGDLQSLAELRPYNGTPVGAQAIADTRRHMEMVEREVARRAEG